MLFCDLSDLRSECGDNANETELRPLLCPILDTVLMRAGASLTVTESLWTLLPRADPAEDPGLEDESPSKNWPAFLKRFPNPKFAPDLVLFRVVTNPDDLKSKDLTRVIFKFSSQVSCISSVSSSQAARSPFM
mmetsp:Transcript_5894/g.9784  ORF Transcript_5894/g.9784 Transcript_5894/m.9784 type:complete len:133 (+) Transcript_5894:238-636(+)